MSNCSFCDSTAISSLLVMGDSLMEEIFFCENHLVSYTHKGHLFNVSVEDLKKKENFKPSQDLFENIMNTINKLKEKDNCENYDQCETKDCEECYDEEDFEKYDGFNIGDSESLLSDNFIDIFKKEEISLEKNNELKTDNLKKYLKKAIKDEDFLKAAELRDLIKKREEKK